MRADYSCPPFIQAFENLKDVYIWVLAFSTIVYLPFIGRIHSIFDFVDCGRGFVGALFEWLGLS